MKVAVDPAQTVTVTINGKCRTVASLHEARKAVYLAFAEKLIGSRAFYGRNPRGCEVAIDGQAIGYVSYNGRLWASEHVEIETESTVQS